MKKLSIIIPAYNEEKAIRSIIERTLAAKEKIKKETELQDVEIIVVNDGSKDCTSEIAEEYFDKNLIKLISYENNRGYGAAIKLGFENSSGDVLSFLDADGTCDPLFFTELLEKMKKTNSDIVIGARLNSKSEMPVTRKIGNIFYRELVNVISSSLITDIASGMRVIKKECIKKLCPLPDGLHFTPAMSVRAILDRDIKIEEVPMPYKERIGKSKLRIIEDGIKFLKTILEISFTYKLLRLFGFLGGLFFLVALIYGIGPVLHYVQYKNVPEYLIYRLIFIFVAIVSGIQLVFAGLITQAITSLAHGYEMDTTVEKILDRFFLKKLAYFGCFFIVNAIVLNYKTISQYITTGCIDVHWSYVVSGGLLILIGFQFLTFSVINRVIILLKEYKKFRS